MSAKSAANCIPIAASTGCIPWFSMRSSWYSAPIQRNFRHARCSVPIGRYTRPSRHKSGLVRATESWSLSSRTVELSRNGRAPSNSRRNRERNRVPSWYRPSFSVLAGPDIAILIEQRKRVAVLQHADGFVGEAGIGQDMMRIVGASGRIGWAGVLHPRASRRPASRCPGPRIPQCPLEDEGLCNSRWYTFS